MSLQMRNLVLNQTMVHAMHIMHCILLLQIHPLKVNVYIVLLLILEKDLILSTDRNHGLICHK